MEDIKLLEQQCISLNERLYAARVEKEELEISEKSLRSCERKVLFYTGMANFTVLLAVFELVESAVSHSINSSLSKFQEFILFMMKMKMEFNIEDSVGFYCACLHVPVYTKGKKQLSPEDVEKTRKLANFRIHVERVIGMIRNKYVFLKSTVPINYVACREGDELTPLDKIVTVCCALYNLCPSIVATVNNRSEENVAAVENG
ncbi:hypothetical protein MTO96_049927 [Rhipicephalus appendiculatus]